MLKYEHGGDIHGWKSNSGKTGLSMAPLVKDT